MKKIMLILTLMVAMVFPSFAEASTFSGGHSSTSHSSFSGSHFTSTGGTYHSGYKSPSSNVSRTPSSSKPYSTRTSYQPSRSSSFWSHAAAFGAGAFLGHMFHPFGGSYYGGNRYSGSYGFSFAGLLVDLIIVSLVVWIIKKIVSRKRRY